LAELRAHLVPARDIEAREQRGRLSTGSAVLDGLLGGGWPRGALSEVRGARGQGRTSVLLASLAAALRAGHAAALVDFGGSFDPWAARRAGVGLDRLLWVRAPAPGLGAAAPARPLRRDAAKRSPARDLLAAAEAIVAAGGFALLVLDFGERTPAVPTSAWLRLRQLVTAPGTAVLVVTPAPIGSLFGATSLCLDAARPRFHGDGQRALRAPFLLTAIEAKVTLRRAAGGAPDAAENSPALALWHFREPAPGDPTPLAPPVPPAAKRRRLSR
jgi:hypothetical protein